MMPLKISPGRWPSSAGSGTARRKPSRCSPLGDAPAAQGQHDSAYGAWQQASLIFSTFSLPEGESLPQSDRIRERLLTYGRSPGVPTAAELG